METGIGETMSRQEQDSSCSGTNTGNAADFECNICLEMVQDPIVTLCGHLYCWPCLYKWLHMHSRWHECPVCKAGIEEEKLVPLYVRGKNSTDPRSKSIPGMEIPCRPTGQRPETASFRNPNANASAHHIGSFAPVATTRFENFVLSTAAISGLLPSGFNIQIQGFRIVNTNRAGLGLHNGHPQGQSDKKLKLLLLVVGVCLLLSLIWR